MLPSVVTPYGMYRPWAYLWGYSPYQWGYDPYQHGAIRLYGRGFGFMLRF
jgi:hypothetical protein